MSTGYKRQLDEDIARKYESCPACGRRDRHPCAECEECKRCCRCKEQPDTLPRLLSGSPEDAEGIVRKGRKRS